MQRLGKLFLTSALIIGLCCVSAIGIAKPKDKLSRPVQPKYATPGLEELHGKILFTRGEEVWGINLDGTGQRRILPQIFKYESGNELLGLSPDNTRLIYSHNPLNLDKFTGHDLFSIRLDGIGQRRLTNTGYMQYSRHPRFSPDGKYIVYSRFTGDRMGGPGYTDAEIRIMKSDGSNDRLLVGDLSNPDQNHYDAYWSLDGQNILFTRTIGCMDYTGEGTVKFEQRIIGTDGHNERPDNGETVKFEGVVSRIDKSLIAAKISKGANIGLVLSSKDGKQIVFQVWEQKNIKDPDGVTYSDTFTEIWRGSSDGRNLRRVTSANSLLLGWLP